MADEKWAPNVPTNASVARKLNMTNGGISRLRSGSKHPSHMRVRLIEQVYGWGAIEQYRAIREGNYAELFEAVLKDADK